MYSCNLAIEEFPLYWWGRPQRTERLSIGLIDVEFEIGYDAEGNWWILSITIEADKGGRIAKHVLSRDYDKDLWNRIYLNLEDVFEQRIFDAIAEDEAERRVSFDENKADYLRELRAAS